LERVSKRKPDDRLNGRNFPFILTVANVPNF
jgi:hypothetical protein